MKWCGYCQARTEHRGDVEEGEGYTRYHPFVCLRCGKSTPNPWWRCASCKRVYQTRLWIEVPRPPEDEIPEVGTCISCLERSKIERQIKEKGFYQPRLFGERDKG